MSDENANAWSLEIPIAKKDEERRLVFGWLSVAKTKDGVYVVDHQGDVIPVAELEAAVYGYMIDARKMGEMHDRTEGADGEPLGKLVESMMFTKEKMAVMGIPEGVVHEGWWVGYRVEDTEVWGKIKDGTYKAFSIGGSGRRSPLG